MPHIVFAGETYSITAQQVVDVKDRLREAGVSARPVELSLVGVDGHEAWLFWTPGAPIVIDDGDAPQPPQFAFPDLAALGLPGFGDPQPPQTRRAGF